MFNLYGVAAAFSGDMNALRATNVRFTGIHIISYPELRFITLNHTGRLTNKRVLLIFATAFYFYLRIFLADKSKPIYGLCGLAFVVTGLGFDATVWVCAFSAKQNFSHFNLLSNSK